MKMKQLGANEDKLEKREEDESENKELADVETDLICNLCGKRFLNSRKYNFERHMETCKKNVSEKPFKCEQCQVARCKTEKLLKHHMKHNCLMKIDTSNEEVSPVIETTSLDLGLEPAQYLAVDVNNVLSETIETTTNASSIGVILETRISTPPGLVNPGMNTCYINAVLQALFHNKNFVKWILSYEKDHGQKCVHSCKLMDLFFLFLISCFHGYFNFIFQTWG